MADDITDEGTYGKEAVLLSVLSNLPVGDWHRFGCLLGLHDGISRRWVCRRHYGLKLSHFVVSAIYELPGLVSSSKAISGIENIREIAKEVVGRLWIEPWLLRCSMRVTAFNFPPAINERVCARAMSGPLLAASRRFDPRPRHVSGCC